MVVLTSKDCDIFSDQFGCIFTACEGYQCPAPILRMGICPGEPTGDIKSLMRLGGPRGSVNDRLVTLNFVQRSSCSSFAQLLSSKEKPVLLRAKGRFYNKVDAGKNVTGIVSVSSGNLYTTSVYVHSASNYEEVVLRGARAISVRDHSIWYVGGAQTPTAYYSSVERTLSSPSDPQSAVALPCDAGNCRDIFALSASTSLALLQKGIALFDSRQSRMEPLAIDLPRELCSGGLAADRYVVYSTAEGRVVVLDHRFAGIPVAERNLDCLVSVRCREHIALLVASDQVGVMEVRSGSLLAGLPSSDGDFLDALLTRVEDGAAHLCASTSNGMLYDWSMAL